MNKKNNYVIPDLVSLEILRDKELEADEAEDGEYGDYPYYKELDFHNDQETRYEPEDDPLRDLEEG